MKDRNTAKKKKGVRPDTVPVTSREGEDRFRTLVENSLDVIMRFDRAYRHLYVNPRVEEQTGIPPGQFIGKTHAELGFPAELVTLWEKALEKVFTTGRVNRVEFQLPGGIWIDWMMVPESSPDGRVETVITYARDITGRKKVEDELRAARDQLEKRVAERTAELAKANRELHAEIGEREEAEEALRRSEETLRLIVEGSPGFFFYVHDDQGNFIYLSPSIKEITGRTLKEWKKHYTAYLTDNPINKQVIGQTERTLRGEGGESSYPVEIEHADGRRIILQVYERPILKNGVVAGIQGIAHDITNRRRLEEQLRHVQKMEAIGTLAGGIAHDFNNILAGITGYAFLGKQRLGRADPVFANLEAIEKLSQRGADLTKTLLAFSHRGEYQPVPVNINRVADDVLKMIKRTAGGRIEIRREFEPGIPNVFGEEGLLHQVLVNLCLNACEAMPDGGILTLRTFETARDDIRLSPDRSPEANRFISVAVSDTGVGMDRETREHIFEPFFTTKSMRSGAGLGLSIVSGIVEKHGGWIEVESTAGAGSGFILCLPATEEAESTPLPAPIKQKEGVETILVVDDDEDFRKVVRRALEQFGYSVLEAANGEEALREVEKRRGEIDLVLLDILMDKMGGDEVLRRIKKMSADLPVVVCSGYQLDLTSRQLLEDGASFFLFKPFEFDTLAATIREVLKRNLR